MKTITLSTHQRLELKRLKKEYQAKHKIFRKLKCIELRASWEKPKQVAEQLDVWNDIICIRCNIFEKEWLQWLCQTHYEWRRVSEFEQYKNELIAMIENNIYNTYSEFYYEICKKYTITKTQDALRKFCKKNWIWVIKSVI
jgi:hypothetical protein